MLVGGRGLYSAVLGGSQKPYSREQKTKHVKMNKYPIRKRKQTKHSGPWHQTFWALSSNILGPGIKHSGF